MFFKIQLTSNNFLALQKSKQLLNQLKLTKVTKSFKPYKF